MGFTRRKDLDCYKEKRKGFGLTQNLKLYEYIKEKKKNHGFQEH